jgi:hypothetical protein
LVNDFWNAVVNVADSLPASGLLVFVVSAEFVGVGAGVSEGLTVGVGETDVVALDDDVAFGLFGCFCSTEDSASPCDFVPDFVELADGLDGEVVFEVFEAFECFGFGVLVAPGVGVTVDTGVGVPCAIVSA